MQKTLLKLPCSWTTCYLLVSTYLLATTWAELIQENQASSDLEGPQPADIDYRFVRVIKSLSSAENVPFIKLGEGIEVSCCH